MNATEFKVLEDKILHADRRSVSEHWEDVNGQDGLLSLLQGDEHAEMRERVLHRWREKAGPHVVLSDAVAYAKKIVSPT